MFNKIAIFFLFLTLSGSSFAWRFPSTRRGYDKDCVIITLWTVVGIIIAIFVIGTIVDIYSAYKKEKEDEKDEKDDNNET